MPMKFGSSSFGFLILFNLPTITLDFYRNSIDRLLLFGLRDFLQRRLDEFTFDIVDFDRQFVDLHKE